MNFRQTYNKARIELKTTFANLVHTTEEAVIQITSSYQERLLQRAIKILAVEIERAQHENVVKAWRRDGINGSKVTFARSPSLWLDRTTYSAYYSENASRYPNTKSVFVDKKKQQKLKTTSAVWPMDKSSKASALRA